MAMKANLMAAQSPNKSLEKVGWKAKVEAPIFSFLLETLVLSFLMQNSLEYREG